LIFVLCHVSQDSEPKTVVRELNGLVPIVELLKSEYAPIQSLALTALQLITEDGQSAFSTDVETYSTQAVMLAVEHSEVLLPCWLLNITVIFYMTYNTILLT